MERSTSQASVDVLPSVLGGMSSRSEPMIDALLQVGPGECGSASEVVDPADEFKAAVPPGVSAPSMAGPEVDARVNRLEPTGPVVQVSPAVQTNPPPPASPEPALGQRESASGSR